MEEIFIYKHSHKNNEYSDLSFLPMMTRRKFSELNKIALSTMYECYENNNIPIIFSSQYGEMERLLKLINQYKNENEVSPASFSSSVHNATVGIFSLLNKITMPYNAVSGGENTLSNGFMNAILETSQSDALFCFADAFKEKKSVSCLIGKTFREGAIKVKMSKGGCKNEDEFNSFINFLEGEEEKFQARYYSLERVK